MLTNAIVTGDLLRPTVCNGIAHSSQATNIERVHHEILDSVSNNKEIRITCLSNIFAPSFVSASKIYSELRLSCDSYGWAEIYDSDLSVSSEFERLVAYLCTYDLVIGFELPPYLCKRLASLNIPSVSCMPSPVRIAQKHLVIDSSIRLNILANLTSSAGPFDKQSVKCALDYRLKSAQRPKRLRDHAEASVLLCLQTLYNPVKIKDGAFARIWEYTGKLDALCGTFSKILIKPHPLEPNPVELIFLLNYYRGVRNEIVDRPIYELFSSGTIDRVVSISSSSCVEAKLFGIDSEFFYFNPYSSCNQLLASLNMHRYYCGSRYLYSGFWADLLLEIASGSA